MRENQGARRTLSECVFKGLPAVDETRTQSVGGGSAKELGHVGG